MDSALGYRSESKRLILKDFLTCSFEETDATCLARTINNDTLGLDSKILWGCSQNTHSF